MGRSISFRFSYEKHQRVISVPLLNHNSYWYFDTQGSNNEHLIREERANSMFRRIKDWEVEPDDYYLIEFKAIKAIERINLITIIPDELLSRIKDPDDNCYLILENFHEGFSYIIRQLYESVINRYKIPPHKMILFTGALDIQENLDKYVEENNVKPFRLETMLEFELSVQSRWENDITEEYPVTLQSKEYDKKYLNFNRRWRPHRPLLTALLKICDLLKHGHVSLAPSDDNRDWRSQMDHIIQICRDLDNEHLAHILMKNRKDIENMPPLYLDKPDLTINQALTEITPEIKKLYEDTYFSVVSETIYFTGYRDWEDSAFLSEKTFKAILFKHPFILVATPNTLKYLKAIGYKTFSPVIDESYDSIEDNTLRMIAIVKEINRLCKLKGPALESYLKYCREICEHNFKVFTEKRTFSYPHEL